MVTTLLYFLVWCGIVGFIDLFLYVFRGLIQFDVFIYIAVLGLIIGIFGLIVSIVKGKKSLG